MNCIGDLPRFSLLLLLLQCLVGVSGVPQLRSSSEEASLDAASPAANEQTQKAEARAQANVEQPQQAQAVKPGQVEVEELRKSGQAGGKLSEDVVPTGVYGKTKCRMAYHMGAILDVAEKACEAIKEATACSQSNQCSKWSELKNFMQALSAKNPEAVWKVCCFRAYKIGGYQTCAKPDETCRKAIRQHVLAHTQQPALLEVAKDSSPVKAKAALQVLYKLLLGLQAARAELWKTDSACQTAMANPNPPSTCGWGKGKGGAEHSLARSDLYCETIEWQYNEMGAGDAYMKHCPGAKARDPAANQAWNRMQDLAINTDHVTAPKRL